VERVQKEARVPVIGHLEGNCHVYIDRDADVRMARTIALNAKMRRTGICGAAETLLVDRACAGTHLGPIVRDLLDAGCEVRGDAMVLEVDPRVRPASEDDWYTEYLDAIIAARVVEGVDAAIAHIARYGSAHTESIVTENNATASASCSASTARSCCITRPPSSRTAASSAWARRSASPPTVFTPAGRLGSSNSRVTSTSCAARDRCGHEAPQSCRCG